MLASLKESDQDEPYPISFYKSAKDKNKNILLSISYDYKKKHFFIIPFAEVTVNNFRKNNYTSFEKHNYNKDPYF